MSIPVHRRPYDVFLSHAHADRELVDRLYELLTEKAGLSIWYDAYETSGGDSIRTTLQRGVEQSRGILVVSSQDAIDSNWVEDELSIAQVERNDSRDFRVIPMRLAGARVDRFMKGQSWIDVPSGKLDGNVMFEVLRSFYPGEQTKDPVTSRDVYISGSWDSEGEFSGRAVCNSLIASGFRLIGDAKDQSTFDLNRIKDVISSCGAFVGVIPFRDETEASSQERPYKYFLAEIDLAASLGLPTLVVADPRISRVDGDDGNWLRMETEADACPPRCRTADQRVVESLAGTDPAALHLSRAGLGLTGLTATQPRPTATRARDRHADGRRSRHPPTPAAGLHHPQNRRGESGDCRHYRFNASTTDRT